MIVCGIDPGLTGSIAFLGEGLERVEDIPVMANGKSTKVKNQVNARGLTDILEEVNYDGLIKRPMIVYLERISSMPGQGVASMFSMGDTFGCIRGVCAALGLPVEIITPKEWKKFYGLGGDKEQARAKAIELFPDMPLSRKKDHNRSEALLIANYGVHHAVK